MNLEKANQLFGVVANIGVLLGIIFLAVEIQQNNELMETQTRAAFSERISESNSLIATNLQLAEVLGKPIADLTNGERIQRRAFRTRVLRNQEFVFLETSRSEIPIDFWKRNLDTVFNIRHWDQVKQDFNQEFANFIDSEIRSD